MRFSCAVRNEAAAANKGNDLEATTTTESTVTTALRTAMRSLQRQLQRLLGGSLSIGAFLPCAGIDDLMAQLPLTVISVIEVVLKCLIRSDLKGLFELGHTIGSYTPPREPNPVFGNHNSAPAENSSC
jgi:hypothetical protein